MDGQESDRSVKRSEYRKVRLRETKSSQQGLTAVVRFKLRDMTLTEVYDAAAAICPGAVPSGRSGWGRIPKWQNFHRTDRRDTVRSWAVRSL